ncbi:hypothetical protein J2Z17_001978 [Rhizobium halophytocola]|uniref:Uncharacterized protein n=1 Tax=Rhizobium halophytocola TaxID=735519 RepID=A0ABS4DXX3_9HYPH|nr:hypothetical protein [Rhizobium halophytocola]
MPLHFSKLQKYWHQRQKRGRDCGPTAKRRQPFSQTVLVRAACAKRLSPEEQPRKCDCEPHCDRQPKPSIPQFPKVHSAPPELRVTHVRIAQPIVKLAATALALEC